MSKTKSLFICAQCDYKSLKWLGCCPECNGWSTFQENILTDNLVKKSSHKKIELTQLHTVSSTNIPRLLTGIGEWDRVMGGGIMPYSLVILTGDPGIGKSTLLLQVCNALASQYRVFYFSTEESLNQVKQRADRVGCLETNLLFSDNADLESIINVATQEKPDVLIIDSIQNCYTSDTQTYPGSVGQLRESAFQLMRLAKEQGVTIILTGHITKEGNIAGPKTLEHMVDAVFYLQGEDRFETRVLRSVKNRFGTVNELGFFEMNSHGLQEVCNINQYLLNDISQAPGSALVSIVEGSRPLLLEIQALTIESKMAIPQRVITGIDHKEVVLIAAILEKYLHIRFSGHDIFFKTSGGFKLKGSTSDLGIALALLSSYFQQPLPEKTIALGEISLTGQIKPINQINIFAKEAEKFGFNNFLISANQKLDPINAQVKRYNNVYELLALFS
ncbi:MAG: DNA repair protein RadA [Candidatus Dependentiae bacterium]